MWIVKQAFRHSTAHCDIVCANTAQLLLEPPITIRSPQRNFEHPWVVPANAYHDHNNLHLGAEIRPSTLHHCHVLDFPSPISSFSCSSTISSSPFHSTQHALTETSPFRNSLHCSHCYLAGAFSLRAASWRSSVSTCSGGIWIYRTTLPRTKQFWRAVNCGYFSGLIILTFKSLTFKYWSTLCSVPVSTTSFFNSTAISLPTSVLKKDRKI